jgi:hypothetical protein
MYKMKSMDDVLKHGQFIPKNPKKYIGKYPIIVRSSWERTFCQWLDNNEGVVAWASESIVIPYFDPVKGKKRRYYPDFYLKTKNGDDFIVEIKPYKETKPPTKRGKKSTKTMLYEEKTWLTNKAKWDAAINWCERMGMKFQIHTEKSLFGK